MLSDIDEGLIHVIVDHITLAILPQIAICLAELEDIQEENPDENDTRPQELSATLRQSADEISAGILGIVHDLDAPIFLPTVDEINDMLQGMVGYEDEEEEHTIEEGFLGYMQEIIDERMGEDDDN